MRLGIDFSGKKEYDELDFFSKSIQDVDWGLIKRVLDTIPDEKYYSLEEIQENSEFFINKECTELIENDPLTNVYKQNLYHILEKFIISGHIEGSHRWSSSIYSVDLLKDEYRLKTHNIPVWGIMMRKLPLEKYGEVLKIINDQFFATYQFGRTLRDQGIAKRMRHVIRILGGKETSESCYTCSRKLTNTLNAKLRICGEPDDFPIRSLDLYADFINSIYEYIQKENEIAYSKICQYKIKITTRLPIYEVSFL